MPLAQWSDTKETLHRFLQIVGKIRLESSVRRNHWWNVPFHLTGRGITTRPMGTDPIFAIDFDFVSHLLLVQSVTGESVSFPLPGHSVASFCRQALAACREIGVPGPVIARPYPFDLPDHDRPFAEDTEHATYDPAWAGRYWRVLSQVGLALEEFASGFSGKTSPVHHFWHTFDLAVTRFSGRPAPQSAGADPVTREAYSQEVVSVGFWFGDSHFPEPAFYSYTAPEPDGIQRQPLRPAAASWEPSRGAHLAVLRYDDARAAADPRRAALDFWQSAYEAGASLAGWDADALRCPGGISDPWHPAAPGVPKPRTGAPAGAYSPNSERRSSGTRSA